ncbi:Bud site selection protein 6 [Coemansia sp. RSA 2599]|nr:Bud site selection protein 6 [Coemansia sp. RSA 2598]KAJ1829055.1 Bud site selection protein 6 [Coemansia sp. RSA 2599]
MSRNDYTHYAGYASRSPEPQGPSATAYGMGNNVRSVPAMNRGYANMSGAGASGYVATNGSLRSTRTNASTRVDSAVRPVPQGSLRRAHLGTFDDQSYSSQQQQQLQPYVPDANERRTPDYYSQAANNDVFRRPSHPAEPGARATPPPLPTSIVTSAYHDPEHHVPRSSSIQRYRANDYEEKTSPSVTSPTDPYHPPRYSRRGSNASNHSYSASPVNPSVPLGSSRLVPVEARKSPAPQRIFPSQRVEFGYSAPAKAVLNRSQTPERDEIADIIADMSKTRIGSTGSDGEYHVYLQLGDETKRAKVAEKVPSMTTVVNLFIDKYREQLTNADNQDALPSIYIKDGKDGVFYELEDTQDVCQGAVLSWRTRPLVPDKPDLTEQKDSDADDSTRPDDAAAQRVQRLVEMVDGLAQTIAGLPAQLREEIQTIAEDVKVHSKEALDAVDARLQQQIAAQTLVSVQPTASATAHMDVDGGTDAAVIKTPAHLSRSASVPAHAANSSSSSAEVKELKDKLRQLELALSVERQERKEAEAKLLEEKTQAQESLLKLQAEVATHPNVLRVRIEEGKTMLKTEYRALNARFEDVDAMVQEMRKDVTQRGSIPSSQLMKKADTEIGDIESGTQKLVRFINDTRADWKRTWEEELQNILKEQSFVKDVEQMIAELTDDTKHLSGIMRKLDKIIDFKLEERSKSDYIPTAATKFIDVVSPDDARDAKKDFLLQISCVDIDHNRRLEALKTAEKLRQQELATKVNEFDEELSDFVGQRKLRKTGGTEELERRRAEKNIEVMKEMLKSVEEAEQARRAKIAQRKAAKTSKK